jgi:ppGpp synthetase/RelA/SpoT-type nucleotidyltranferase
MIEIMDTLETIDSIIARKFPLEWVQTDLFVDWCEDNILERIQPIAANVIKELEGVLEHEKRQLAVREKAKRDCWKLFGNENPVKSVKSIRSKIAREIDNEEKKNGTKTVSRLTPEDLENRTYNFSDLARVRIVCTFYSDVRYLSTVLLDGDRFLSKYGCPEGIKDFIYDPQKRDGLKGHRARQFSARVPLEDNVAFGFEVQLMTLLQHAWDRRNHPIYEWIRENKQLSSELIVNDFACSEALHVVDQQADRNWKKYLEETQNGK